MKPTHFLTAAFAVSAALACATPDASQQAASGADADRAAIVAAVDTVASAADARDWPRVEATFTERVTLDYGTPEELTAAEVVRRWSALLPGFDATEHRLSGHDVKVQGDTAEVTSRFVAVHRITGAPGGDTWTLEGTYAHRLVRTPTGWRVSAMRMSPGRSTGNPALLELAKERAAGVRVQARTVRFQSHGETLVGHLYLPPGDAGTRRLPALVVTGSWTTVKEQMAGRYARRLAAEGFATLAFDFRGYGESGGTPRGFESPARKVQDIRSALSFLEGLPEVDGRRLGAVGVCASAGYEAQAAAEDPRIRSLVLVAPWLHDEELVKSIYGGEEGVRSRMQQGREARLAFERTGEVRHVPTISTTDKDAAMFGEWDYYLNPARGAVPQWDTRFAVMSWEAWLSFAPTKLGPRIRVPTLMVHSRDAALPQGLEKFAASLAGPQELVWLQGTQFDFYDGEAQVQRSVAEATRHLRATLPPG